MNDVFLLLVSKALDNLLPLLITTLVGWATVKLNSIINLKKEEYKNNNLVVETLNKFTINESQQKFIEQKALEAVKFAEEKAFQAWKDNSKKELTAPEKKEIAVNQLIELTKDVVRTKDINLNVIDTVVSNSRGILDSIYINLKKNFINSNGLPENARNPYTVSVPQITPEITVEKI